MTNTKKFYCDDVEIYVKYSEFMVFSGIDANIDVSIFQKDTNKLLDSLYVEFRYKNIRNVTYRLYSRKGKECICLRSNIIQVITDFINKYCQADCSAVVGTIYKYLKRCERTVFSGIVCSKHLIEKFHFEDSISVSIKYLEYDTYTDYNYIVPRLDYFISGIIVSIVKHVKDAYTREVKNIRLGYMKLSFLGDDTVFYYDDRAQDLKYRKCKTNEIRERASKFVSSRIPPEMCDNVIKSLVGYLNKCEEVVTI